MKSATNSTVLQRSLLVVICLSASICHSAPSDVAKAWRKSSGTPDAPAYRVTPSKLPDSTSGAPAASAPYFPDVSTLRGNQAKHAWNQMNKPALSGGKPVPRSAEFRRRGINSARELQARAQEIRQNHDIRVLIRQKESHNLRIAYGKYDPNGKSGLIVIDNPMDRRYGGTIVDTPDLRIRMQQLKRSE